MEKEVLERKGLFMVQDVAARSTIGIGHCVAFACSGPVALISVRVLFDALPALMGILILTAVVTLIIGMIDYGPLASVAQDRRGG